MNVNLPITVDKFFELFISDNASYSLFHFHERRGDTVKIIFISILGYHNQQMGKKLGG